jgi:hypothetical protein
MRELRGRYFIKPYGPLEKWHRRIRHFSNVGDHRSHLGAASIAKKRRELRHEYQSDYSFYKPLLFPPLREVY